MKYATYDECKLFHWIFFGEYRVQKKLDNNFHDNKKISNDIFSVHIWTFNNVKQHNFPLVLTFQWHHSQIDPINPKHLHPAGQKALHLTARR